MSQPGKKGGGSKGQKPDKDDSKDKIKETPNKDDKKDKDDKDKNNGDGDKAEGPPSPPKPQSAGASIRDAAQRILNLTSKGEWSPIEQIIKQIERQIANCLAQGEEVVTNPLSGISDPVRYIVTR